MRSGKELLKSLIWRTCSPQLQQKFRRFYLAKRVIKNKGSREPEIGALRSLVSTGDSVADVGANVGVYTKELSSLVGPSGQINSFEPISENYEILETVITKAHLSNVRSFRAALGLQLGQREMVIPDLGGFTGYYLAHFAHPNDSGRRETVDVLTLDELWKRNTIQWLDFIKCDVEGSELEVIRGGLELIHSERPGWLLEVSRKASGEVFSLLRDLGYRGFVYDGKWTQTESYRDKEFSNYFFFHPQSKIWKRVLSHL